MLQVPGGSELPPQMPQRSHSLRQVSDTPPTEQHNAILLQPKPQRRNKSGEASQGDARRSSTPHERYVTFTRQA